MSGDASAEDLSLPRCHPPVGTGQVGGSPAPGKGLLRAPTLSGYSVTLCQPLQTPSLPPSQALYSGGPTLPLQTNISLAQQIALQEASVSTSNFLPL